MEGERDILRMRGLRFLKDFVSQARTYCHPFSPLGTLFDVIVFLRLSCRWWLDVGADCDKT